MSGWCRQCQTFKTQITHYQGRVNFLARKLNSPNAKNTDKILTDLSKAKTQLSLYKNLSDKHNIEHDMAEL